MTTQKDSLVGETHFLKIWPVYYQAILDGRKSFEVRREDRPFGIMDILALEEWTPDMGYTGNACKVKVIEIWRGGPGLKAGYCAMSIGAPYDHVGVGSLRKDHPVDKGGDGT